MPDYRQTPPPHQSSFRHLRWDLLVITLVLGLALYEANKLHFFDRNYRNTEMEDIQYGRQLGVLPLDPSSLDSMISSLAASSSSFDAPSDAQDHLSKAPFKNCEIGGTSASILLRFKTLSCRYLKNISLFFQREIDRIRRRKKTRSSSIPSKKTIEKHIQL